MPEGQVDPPEADMHQSKRILKKKYKGGIIDSLRYSSYVLSIYWYGPWIYFVQRMSICLTVLLIDGKIVFHV